jgi:hypothetical protein
VLKTIKDQFSRGHRARKFAEEHFHSCEAHLLEAAAVHRALESLSRRELRELNPAASIREVLGEPAESFQRWFDAAHDTPGNAPLLQLTPQAVVTEAPHAAPPERWTELVFSLLLGPHAKRSRWTIDTIWTRSIRGVVNERVRWGGRCACIYGSPPNERRMRRSPLKAEPELMDEFASSWRVLSAGSVIEFTFAGVHHWTHGPQMMSYVESVLAQQSAARIVINLHDYSYEFGNDLFGLFTAVGFDRPTRQVRPVCVVARGQTKASLRSLLAAGKMGNITFVTTPAELAEWLGKGRQTSA